MIVVAFFIIGLIIGSFLNVCIYRIPRGKSIVYPPSSCPLCGARLKWYDNIPVISYIVLKGRCRYCKGKISPIYPVVELLTAIYSVLVYLKFGITLNTVFYLIFGYILIAASFIDFFHYIIPDSLTLSLAFVGLAYGIVNHELVHSIVGLIFGFVLLYVVAVLGKVIFKKEAMGGGDIKLLAALGTFVGVRGVLFTLFVASFLGSLVGVVLIASGNAKMSQRLPFGPYLSLSAIIYLFVGAELLAKVYGF